MARAREFAVGAALGASRLQSLRPLIAESLLLAFAGGVCAILVAMWTGEWLAAPRRQSRRHVVTARRMKTVRTQRRKDGKKPLLSSTRKAESLSAFA